MQRWLERELLPRTGLEPSLQLSIVTIFGYVGAITAIALALTGLGFDLQKIALIAGALSVGIGFGLQSIVSNFVSGLILLTERPIRVGDFDRRERRRGLGPARARARNRDRDVRSGQRDHSEFGVHHRRRQELDAREQVGPDRGQGRGRLRQRPGPGARHPDRHRQRSPADRSDPSSGRASWWHSGKRRWNSNCVASWPRSRKACRSGAISTTRSSRSSARPQSGDSVEEQQRRREQHRPGERSDSPPRAGYCWNFDRRPPAVLLLDDAGSASPKAAACRMRLRDPR